MPKTEQLPAVLFYVDDFASDGIVEAMTTEQVGAYILLLCKAWREDPPGTIPDDDEVLARWSRLPAKKWIACRDRVLKAFTMIDGRWHQKRMKKEYQTQVENEAKRSAAGKRGSDARWKPNAMRPHSDGSATEMRKNANQTNSNGVSNNQSKVLPLTAAQFGLKEFADEDWKRELSEISRLVGDTTEDCRILGQLAWLVCAGAPITQQVRDAVETVKMQRDDGKPPDSPVAYLRGTLEKSVGKDTLAAMLKRAPPRKHFSEASEAL